MCCICGGGSTSVPESEYCFDSNNDATDTEKNGCDWYDIYGSCGFFDDDDFIANEMCCSCGGGTM